jgi:hypothetical protein
MAWTPGFSVPYPNPSDDVNQDGEGGSGGGSGGGAVDSVDGRTGVVTLGDLYDAAGAAADAQAASQPLDADLTTLSGAGNSAVLAATTAAFTTADETKLDGLSADAEAIIWDPVADDYIDGGRIFVGPTDPTNAGYTGAAGDFWLNPDLLPSNVGRLLGAVAYDPATDVDYTTTATMTALDATNVSVTFTVPDSGSVLIRSQVQAYPTATTGSLILGIMEASTTLKQAQVGGDEGTNTVGSYGATWKITGLTPGATKTYKLAAKHSTNAWHVRYGDDYMPALFEIWDAASGNGVVHPLVDDDTMASATSSNVPSAESVVAYVQVTRKAYTTLTDHTSFGGTSYEQWGTEEPRILASTLPRTTGASVTARLVGTNRDGQGSEYLFYKVQISLDDGATWVDGPEQQLFPEGTQYARFSLAANCYTIGTIATAVQARAMVKSAAGGSESKDQISGSIILEVTV